MTINHTSPESWEAEFDKRFDIQLGENQEEVKSFIWSLLTAQREEFREKIVIGSKVIAYGQEYIIVGLSTMVYDQDCSGEPEWKITKDVKEVAITKDYLEISFQKPAWISVNEVTFSPSTEGEGE